MIGNRVCLMAGPITLVATAGRAGVDGAQGSVEESTAMTTSSIVAIMTTDETVASTPATSCRHRDRMVERRI